MIGVATEKDLEVIISIIDEARETMKANGNPTQWPEGYPAASTIEDDIATMTGYVIEEEGISLRSTASPIAASYIR